MPADTLLVLQASTTKTATFSGAGVSLITGTPPGQVLVARVIYSAASNASGANAFTFQVDGSTDNATWAVIGGAGGQFVVNLSTTVQSGELFIPFEYRVSPTFAAGALAWVRLTATLSGAGTVPTITYQGDTVIAYP